MIDSDYIAMQNSPDNGDDAILPALDDKLAKRGMIITDGSM